MLSILHAKHLPDLALHLNRAALAFSLLFPLPFAQAVGLGEYEVQSALGRPLRLVVQVTARADETIEASCFRIHPFNVASDGLPQLTGAQLALDNRTHPQRLIVTSARPVLDPIVRVSINVGCDTTLRRDLTLLLDPLPVVETQAIAESEPPVGASIAPAAPAAGTAAGAESGPSTIASGADAGANTGSPRMSTAETQPGRSAAPAAPRAGREVGAANASKGTPRPPRAAKATSPQPARQARPRPPKAASPQPGDRLSISTSGPPLEAVAAAPITPRLTLSTSLSDRAAQPPLPETVLSILRQKQARLKAAPAEEDIPSLEAELVVLQRRAAEMRIQLDAVLAQLRSLPEASGTAGAGSAPAAQPAAAESGAAATPVSALPREAPASRWNWLEPPLLFALLLGLFFVVLIVGGAIWLRRESSDSRRAARWNKTPYVPVAAPAAASPSPLSFGPEPEIEQVARATVPPEQPPLPESYMFLPHAPGQAARELGVSDLAQATEKAGVFVTLGRPERAIDVLRDHVEHEPNPSPMAWLMLLDLYRQSGQRSEFTDVAQRFHREFNAAAPAWEQAAPLNEADLGAFPRVVGKIRDDWPKPESRAAIEELLYDNRGGSRVGFSLPAFRDLLLLHSIIDEHLLALEAPARIDPLTGTAVRPPPPAPPPHLAAVWAAPTAVPPEAPAESSMHLDIGLLSDSTERSALEAGYPIIAEAIVTRWGKPGVADYLGTLIQSATDDRGPNLSDETMTELIMLHDIALELGDPQPDYSIA